MGLTGILGMLCDACKMLKGSCLGKSQRWKLGQGAARTSAADSLWLMDAIYAATNRIRRVEQEWRNC